MNDLILILILSAATVYVALPYWQRRVAVKSNLKNSHIADLLERRDNLLATIKDIEFDYQTGKISPEDFAEMNAKYRSEAVAILKRIDGAVKGKNKNKEKIEAELRQLKARRKNTNGKFCANCGNAVQPGDRFCTQCGTRLI